MKPNKVFAAFLVVGPGEGDRYLEQTLKQLWTDEICIVLNNADPKTKEIAQKYGTIISDDNREWGREQWRIKQEFLNRVIDLCKPPTGDLWIWCLDSDEIFDSSFTRNKAEELSSGHDIAYYFWCLQLWNSEEQVRLDLSFPNIRFYKVIPEFGLHFQATALHCGLAPVYAYKWGSQSNLYFKHYGLMNVEDRKRKVERYELYDPSAKYKAKDWYDALKNEKARSVDLKDAIGRLPELIRKTKEIKNRMKKDKQVFMFRNPHGKVVPAVGLMQREQFIKMKYTELSSISANSNPEAAVVKAPEEVVEKAPVTEYQTDLKPQTEYVEEKPKTKKNAAGKKNAKKVS